MIKDNKTIRFDYELKAVHEQFKEACEWIDTEMGFKYKSTRMGSYEKELEEFQHLDLASLHEDEQLYKKFYIFMQSTTEACQIIRIWNAFKMEEHEGLKERVKHVMTGKSLRAEAIKKNAKGNNDDPARDFSFELGIASRFLTGGFKVDLSTKCDVVVDLGNSELFVECKRLKSKSQLAKRTKKAASQIKSRIGKNRKKKYGMIALDVTDLLIPDGDVAVAHNVVSFDRAKQDSQCAEINR